LPNSDRAPRKRQCKRDQSISIDRYSDKTALLQAASRNDKDLSQNAKQRGEGLDRKRRSRKSKRFSQRSFGSAHDEKSCRTNSGLFLEAVNTRQVASICEEGAKRQHDLDMLDAEINAFNDLIAAQCGGS
jgi:hypothetical protein